MGDSISFKSVSCPSSVLSVTTLCFLTTPSQQLCYTKFFHHGIDEGGVQKCVGGGLGSRKGELSQKTGHWVEPGKGMAFTSEKQSLDAPLPREPEGGHLVYLSSRHRKSSWLAFQVGGNVSKDDTHVERSGGKHGSFVPWVRVERHLDLK